MLSSIRYTRKSAITLSTTFSADKKSVAQILLFKLIILLILFIFTPILNEELMCIIITVAASLQFWVSKNLGRKFLNASWCVHTEGQEDEWIFEAGLKSPTETYEAIFWYSFILYGILLIPIAILLIHDSKLSLFCAVLIAFTTNYINFYAFSQIIEMRNEGVLQRLAQEAYGGGAENVKLPMGYVSRLGPIQESPSGVEGEE